MSSDVDTLALPAALEQAQSAAEQQNLPYAGGVAPPIAWQLIQQREAVLVDVRSGEERKFVGHVPESLHVPWATGTALTRNPRFVRELEAKPCPACGACTLTVSQPEPPRRRGPTVRSFIMPKRMAKVA